MLGFQHRKEGEWPITTLLLTLSLAPMLRQLFLLVLMRNSNTLIWGMRPLDH